MPVSITWNTTGVWGVGTGVLDAVEVDENFYSVKQAIEALEADRPQPDNIASITTAANGTQWIVHLDSGTQIGPLPIPVLQYRDRGQFVGFAVYAALDIFTAPGEGLYSVLIPHTAAATFDEDAGDTTQITDAPDLVGNRAYRIESVGTTDFTAIGATANTVGLVFVATGPGTGTGTASPTLYNKLIGFQDLGTSLALADLTDVDVAGAAENDMLVLLSGDWTNQSPTQVTALLDVFDGTTKGLVPVPGSGTDGAVLGADGSWVLLGLDDLVDVDMSTPPSNGQLLVWDSTAGLAVFADVPGVSNTLGGLTDVDLVALADGDVLVYDQASGHWINSTTGGGITALTGDVIATGPGSANAVLAPTGVTTGTFTNATVTVDAKGRITAAASGSATVNSAALDAAFGNTRGSILTRSVSGWVILIPGADGYLLESQGPGADIHWVAPNSLGLDPFTGASATGNGTEGLVPAPQAGEEDFVLYGDGTWGALSGGTLNSLTDVDITGLSDGDHLQWTGTGEWIVTSIGKFSTVQVKSSNSPVGTVSTVTNYVDAQDPETAFPFIALRQALGTEGAEDDIIIDASLGGIAFYGWEGADFKVGAGLRAQATENWTPTAHGARLLFQVTPAGTTVPTFPLVLEEDTLLLNGSPVLVEGGGGLIEFIEGGAWDQFAGYAAYTVVTFNLHYWINNVPIAASSGFSNPDLNSAVITIQSAAFIELSFPGGTVLNVGDILYFVAHKLGAADISAMSINQGAVTWTGPRYNSSGLEIWWGRVTTAYTGAFTVRADYTANISSQASCTLVKDINDPTAPFDIGAPVNSASNTATVNTTSDFTSVLLIGLNTSTSVPGNAAGWTFLASNNWFNTSSQTLNSHDFSTVQSGLSATMTGATRIIYDVFKGLAPNPEPGTSGGDWVLIGDVNDNVGLDLDTEFDAAFGSTEGTLIVRGAGSAGWVGLAPGVDDQILTMVSGAPEWADNAGGGGGGGGGAGLFAQLLSELPTASTTGLGTWRNQGGASVSDNNAGFSIIAPSAGGAANWRLRTRAAPSTPYTIRTLVSMTTKLPGVFASVAMGWDDGTKLHVIELSQRTSSPSPLIYVNRHTNVTTFSSSDVTGGISSAGNMIWLQLRDDGTQVHFEYSYDGVNFVTAFSHTKSGGYLANYNTICFGVNPFGCDTVGTILSWGDAAGVGSGLGLFSQVRSITPTSTTTGLTTWQNQGTASVTDGSTGVVLTVPAGAGDNLRIRKKTAPSTPYTITALIALEATNQNFQLAGIGWTDGTKLHTIHITQAGVIEVARWSTVTAFSAQDAANTPAVPQNPYWLQISDDGTNVIFRCSKDGVTFRDVFSVAKASGYLGSSGYTSVLFFANRQNSVGTSTCYATLMSYKQGA